jgi:hypothetical protein
MQYIKDHPEQHDQSVFACGTSACFAGWAAILSGWSARDVQRNWNMWATGAELLGIDAHSAAFLFAPWNTISMLESMVQDLVNGDELRTSSEYKALVMS